MAYTVADRVKETTAVTGTGPVTLLGAVSGYRTFASQLSIGDTCAYAIVNANASEWEVGIGTYSAANTLTRTTVHASTNSNAAVVFTAGTKDVFLSPTAETVLSDVTSTDGTVTLTKTGSIVDLSVAVAAATTNVIVQVRNTTGATLTKGTVVYINDALGQLPTVAKALATSDATSAQTLGMISADLGNNENGYVTIIGLIEDISLDIGTYNDGDQLYLSGTTAGAFTNVKPYAPTHLVYVGVVEHAHNIQGKIFVKVQNGYELDELHDVSAQNPSNGQTIVYNSTNQLWEKNTVSLTAGVNGILPVINGGTGVTTATGTGSVVLSTSPTLTRATFAAGTISASTPNTITQTWNNAAVTFSALTENITDNASASASLLVDLQVGGVSKFAVRKDGTPFFTANIAAIPAVSSLTWYGNTGATTPMCAMTTGSFTISSNSFFGWTGRNSGIYQPVDHTYEYRGGTNPQSFRVYNTYTSASVYERASLSWASNVCTLTTESTTAGAGRNLVISAGNGVTSGAGGSLILQAGIQATSGGDGKVVVKQAVGQSAYFFELQNSAGTAFFITSTDANANIFPTFGSASTSRVNFVVAMGSNVKLGSTHINYSTYASKDYGFATSGSYYWAPVVANTQVETNVDLALNRDAADTLAQRRSTNAQTFRLYNTYTDASNYERLGLTWASNVCTIGLAQAGTGATRNLVIAGATATTGAGGNVTITAGSGSGVGAGGNIILQPGAQGTSGGNGKIRINDTAGVDTGFNFTRGYAGYPTLDQNRVYLRSATDNNQVIEFRSDAGAGNINIGPTGSVLSLGSGSNYVGIKEKSNSGTVSVISGSYTGTTGSSFAFPNATTAIAANTNDLALPASAFQRLNCTTPCSLTGIAPVTGTGSVHVDGRMIRIYNVGNANLTLAHNSTSTTGNKFYNATGADIILAPNDYAELIYDSTNNGSGNAGWRVA